MRFSLIPREEKFHDLFDQQAAVVTRGAEHFLALLTHFDRLHERNYEIQCDEHECDELVEKIITALDRTFITPIDREDIHSLATCLDDVLDAIEDAAHRFEAFRIERPTDQAITLGRIIQDCCKNLEAAVRLTRRMKNVEAIQEHLRAISRLENNADRIYREVDGAFFASPPDLLHLIKWRELYSCLEATVDACKAAALVVSEIVVKGS